MKHTVLSLSLGLLMMGVSLLAPQPAATQTQECTIIDFEELGHADLIGTYYAHRGVRFETFDTGNGIAWAVLSANYYFQNPPSGNQAATLSFGGQPPCGLQADAAPGADIIFDPPVQSVQFYYAACNDVSIEMFDKNGVYLGEAMTGKTGQNQPHQEWRLFGIELPSSVIQKITVSGIALIDDLKFCSRQRPACRSISASSNFNNTPISAGHFIWFNSALKVSGLGSAPVTIGFEGSTIQFAANGTNYHLPVPNARITFSPTATTATTTFDAATRLWLTTVPVGFDGNAFVSGLVLPVTNDLPGGINPVTWTGIFTTDTPGVTVQWKWAAAVYTNFSTDYNALGVKPVDDNRAGPFQNSIDAGTPTNFMSFVTNGARGTGGANFTGSYKGARPTTPCVVQ